MKSSALLSLQHVACPSYNLGFTTQTGMCADHHFQIGDYKHSNQCGMRLWPYCASTAPILERKWGGKVEEEIEGEEGRVDGE